jgi:uncharacterized protein (DUF433 family)
MNPHEVWDVPLYSPALAGRLVGLRAERVRRWLFGYQYAYDVHGEKRRGKKGPVVKRRVGVDARYATFLDLIDLLFVKKFLDEGVTLQRVRRALDEARDVLDSRHFAHRQFFTDGREIYLQMKGQAEALLQLMSHGQWVIAPVIQEVAARIEFDDPTGFARRWYPLGREGLVVLDPEISFGAPTILEKGVETAAVYDLFVAEHEHVDAVCSWMKLRRDEVESAIRFESQLKAA